MARVNTGQQPFRNQFLHDVLFTAPVAPGCRPGRG